MLFLFFSVLGAVLLLVLVPLPLLLEHLGFRVVFPVTRVDGLGKGAEVSEGVGFANAGDLVLDTE